MTNRTAFCKVLVFCLVGLLSQWFGMSHSWAGQMDDPPQSISTNLGPDGPFGPPDTCPNPSSFSGNPIRYANGEIKLAAPGITDPLGSRWFGYTPTYNNQYFQGSGPGVNADGQHTYSWFIQQCPYLFKANSGQLVVVMPPNDSYWFTYNSSTGDYNPSSTPFADRVTLSHDTTNGIYHLIVKDERFDFRDFSGATLDSANRPQGAFISYVAASGVKVATTSFDSNGNLLEMQRTFPGSTTIHSITLHYTDFSSTDNNLRSSGIVPYLIDTTLFRISDDNGSTFRSVRQVVYNYYDSSNNTPGAEGDSWQTEGALRYAAVQIPNGSSWTEVSRSYYRYMNHQNRNKSLSLVLGPEGWRRMIAASQDPTNDVSPVTDQYVLPYADYFFGTVSGGGNGSTTITVPPGQNWFYDGNQRVTYEQAAAGMGGSGGGCTSCGGSSSATFGDIYTYTNNTNANANNPTDPYNSWSMKTTVTHADGNVDTVYTNLYGQVMLKLFTETGSSPLRQWGWFYRYDTLGHLIQSAQPSALILPSGGNYSTLEGAVDPGNSYTYWLLGSPTGSNSNFNSSSGLIRVRAYYQPADGAVAGEVKNEGVQQGGGGTPVLTRAYTYTNFSYTDSTTSTTFNVNRLASVTEYPIAGNTTTAYTTSYTYTSFTNSTQVMQRVTTLPAVATGHNGSGTSNTITELYDQLGNLIWRMDERGFIVRQYYTTTSGSNILYKGTVQEQIQDVNMSLMSSDPTNSVYNPAVPSWSTPTGGGLHLITDNTYDDLSRLTQVLGPSHQADVSGTPTTLRSATWYVYVESGSGDQVWTGYGYATGTAPSYTYTSVGPVTITGRDKAGMVTDNILAQRSTTTGALSLSDTFPQSNWQRWTNIGYDNQHQKQYSRLYHVIPTTGAGSSGTNYDETDFGFDNMGRLVRVKNPGSLGTVTRTVFDPEGRIVATYVGTNDVPSGDTCWCHWTPTSSGVDTVQVTSIQYDAGNSGGDNLPTNATQYQDSSTTRVWAYGYDFRDRRTSTQGPVDYYEVDTFDNLDHITQVDRYNTTSSGNLISRRASSYDDMDRVYQTLIYAVTPSTGAVGNALTGNTWYDASGNIIKTNAAGSGSIFNKSVYDGVGRVTARYVSYDLSEGTPGTYADAFNVTNDTVVQQTETAYDAAGNVIQTTTHERLNDATGTGVLSTISGSQPKARVTNQVMYYDPINRGIATADYGTNGDAALTRPSSIPTSSATILVSKTAYDVAGMPYQSTDPRGLITQTTFDQAGRKSSVAEDTGTNNRTTNYTYTPDNLVATMTAVNPGTGNQVTTYVYGSTTTESAVASSTLLRAVIYPDSDDVASPLGNGSDGIYNRVQFTYNRLGEPTSKEDNNQSIHSYDYDGLGRQVNDRVTSFLSGGGVDQTVKRISRTFEVRGMVVGTLSYDNATVGSGTILNDDERSYNAFGQLATDAQSHSGAVVPGTSPQTSYAYDSGGSINEIRPTSVTYPNARVVYYNYNDAGDTAGISAAINRVTAICTNTTRGTSDANVIAAYDYLGFNHFLRESYPTPQIRLDYWGGTSGTFTGWDNFSRVVSQDWVNYSGTAFDVFKINHGYDQDSNRLYAQNTVYGGASQVYTYDTLNRLTQYKAGSIKSDNSDIQSYWTRAGQQWTLDVLGNQTAVAQWDNGTGGFLGWNQTTFDKANKPTGTYVRANAAKSPLSDPFTSNTAANWVKPGSGDAFNVNSTNAGYLTATTVARDTVNSVQEDASQVVLLHGEKTGPAYILANGTIPSGTGSGQQGMIFGYKSWNDYWLQVLDLSNTQKVYHVVNGTKSLIGSGSWSNGAGSAQGLYVSDTRRYLFSGFGYSFGSSGMTSGQVGLFTTVANTKFTPFSVYEDSSSRDMAGRWTNWQPNLDGLNAVNPSTSRYKFSSNGYGNYRPSMLKNLRLNKFQAVFSVKRESSATSNNVDFVFNGADQDSFDSLKISHSSAATAPYGYTEPDGINSAVTSETRTSANAPALGASDILWVQVTFNGSTVTVKEQINNSSTPTAASWNSLSNCYSSSSFRTTGGMLGFKTETSLVSVGSLSVSSYDTATSAFDITEQQDNFAVDSNNTHSTYGMASDTPTSDVNGNLTYDGDQSYTYDAWNRLKTVKHGYRDSSNNLHSGQALDTMSYDGLDRRIMKSVSGTGIWDCTFNYYLNKDSVVEERNGSNQTIKQFVWGRRYFDELVQTSINSNPTGQSTCDVSYWVEQDANWNVLGLVNSSGTLIERYEYTPYGQRLVYYSSGTNDPQAYSPTVASQKVVTTGSVTQPYGVCEVGHQGLMYDEENSLVYNRSRYLSPTLGTFLSRDALGYANTTNLYQYMSGSPIGAVDPTGDSTVDTALAEAIAAGNYEEVITILDAAGDMISAAERAKFIKAVIAAASAAQGGIFAGTVNLALIGGDPNSRANWCDKLTPGSKAYCACLDNAMKKVAAAGAIAVVPAAGRRLLGGPAVDPVAFAGGYAAYFAGEEARLAALKKKNCGCDPGFAVIIGICFVVAISPKRVRKTV